MPAKCWVLTLTGAGTSPVSVHVPEDGPEPWGHVVLVDEHGHVWELHDGRLTGALESVRSDLEYHVRVAMQRAGIHGAPAGTRPEREGGHDVAH